MPMLMKSKYLAEWPEKRRDGEGWDVFADRRKRERPAKLVAAKGELAEIKQSVSTLVLQATILPGFEQKKGQGGSCQSFPDVGPWPWAEGGDLDMGAPDFNFETAPDGAAVMHRVARDLKICRAEVRRLEWHISLEGREMLDEPTNNRAAPSPGSTAYWCEGNMGGAAMMPAGQESSLRVEQVGPLATGGSERVALPMPGGDVSREAYDARYRTELRQTLVREEFDLDAYKRNVEGAVDAASSLPGFEINKGQGGGCKEYPDVRPCPWTGTEALGLGTRDFDFTHATHEHTEMNEVATDLRDSRREVILTCERIDALRAALRVATPPGAGAAQINVCEGNQRGMGMGPAEQAPSECVVSSRQSRQVSEGHVALPLAGRDGAVNSQNNNDRIRAQFHRGVQ